MRKTPQERIESYRAQAAQIEERERRKLLGRSPQWMATKRAIANIELAIECLPDGASALRDVLEDAYGQMNGCMMDEIGPVTQDGIGAL